MNTSPVFLFLGDSSIKIQPFSFPNTSVIGKRVVATCTTSTNEKMDFKWLKNGREITNTQRSSVRSFPEFSTFIIDSLSVEDAGNYTCVAGSRGYADSYTTTLNVLGNKVINNYLSLNCDNYSLLYFYIKLVCLYLIYLHNDKN